MIKVFLTEISNKFEHFLFKECFYLLRNLSGVIPTPFDIQEANNILPAYLECGIINNTPLVMCEQLMLKVNFFRFF